MIALRIDENDRDLCARWNPPADGQRGTVEIHIGDDVYVDEWADCPLLAQLWVDDFDVHEYVEQLEADEYEPDFEYDPEDGRYYRCG